MENPYILGLYVYPRYSVRQSLDGNPRSSRPWVAKLAPGAIPPPLTGPGRAANIRVASSSRLFRRKKGSDAAVIPAPIGRGRVANTPCRLEEAAFCCDDYSEVWAPTDTACGHLAGVPSLIPGHVNVGRIAEVRGEPVDLDGNRLVTGQVVTFLDVHETCGQCWFCTVAKAATRCPSRRVYGITYGANEGLLGGWAEMIYLKPGVKVLPLPAEVPPERYIGAGCGLPTSVHAIERAESSWGIPWWGRQRPGGAQCGHPGSVSGARR